jgi:hypothetical protein
MSKKNVKRVALSDISKYLKEQNIQIMDGNGDVWVVSASAVAMEAQKLNVKKLTIKK